jgi:hypothetical protein
MQPDHGMRTGTLVGVTDTDDTGEALGPVEDVFVKNKEEPTVIVSIGGCKKLVAFPRSRIRIQADKPVSHGVTSRSRPAATPVRPSIRWLTEVTERPAQAMPKAVDLTAMPIIAGLTS